MDQNDVIIKVQVGSNLTPEQYQKFYMDIINSLNDRLIPVLSIVNNDIEVFNNKQGFTEKR